MFCCPTHAKLRLYHAPYSVVMICLSLLCLCGRTGCRLVVREIGEIGS